MRWHVLVGLWVVISVGCSPEAKTGKETPKPEAATRTEAAPSAKGAPEVAPGGSVATGAEATAPGVKCEHGVEKAICTRCDPRLEAAFKAKGDWCAEHARPESQCALCHPDLAAQGVK
jgi:hypothetical protein